MIGEDEATRRPATGSHGEPHWFDPRALVVSGALVAVAAVATLAVVLSGASARTSGAANDVRVAMGTPIARIDDAIEAGSLGQTHVALAAATTGAERNRHLQAAIAAGETAAKAWTRYQAAALPLPGESELADRYERDLASAKETAADAITPILAADGPVALPKEQLEAAALNQADLRGLRGLYEREQAAVLLELGQRADRSGLQIRIGTVVSLALIVVAGLIGLRMAHRTVRLRQSRTRSAELEAFESMLVRGLELLDDEDQAWAAAARALATAAPAAAVGLSTVDHTGTAMRTTAGTMACGVDRATRCPALRTGSAMHFADSTALNACPHLADAPRCSATCLPISIAGRSAGVAQLTGGVEDAPGMGGAVPVVVRRVGERITMLRAIARIERQAARDPLTGLINRRTLDREVADLEATGAAYAVAFADLDHFKRLNDIHGHQAGDQALRAFAATLADGLRSVDLACRWGGEEFVVVLPARDASEAAAAMERVRALLRAGRSPEAGPAVTVSVGIAVHRANEGFAETLVRADGALATAKAMGRDRVEVWAPPSPAPTRLRPARSSDRRRELGVGEPA